MMHHLGEHNQVKSGNVWQAFVCRECGRLFCDSDSLTRHIIIHPDGLEEHVEEIRDGDFEGRAPPARCPPCMFGCNCLRVFVQCATTQENLKHYYVCEECDYITLTQQALEAHLHVAHAPGFSRMSHTDDSDAADLLHFQCQLDFFSQRDKVSETPPDIELRQSRWGEYKKFAFRSKVSRLKPDLLTSNFKERARLSHPSVKHEDAHSQKSKEQNADMARLKIPGSCARPKPLPSLWRIDKRRNLLVPVEQTDAAAELTGGKQDDDNDHRKALGSSKQTVCLAAPDVLPSASKSDQTFSRQSQNAPPSGRLPEQVQSSPSERKKSTPLHSTPGNVDGDSVRSRSQRRRKHWADRESAEGCHGRHPFSDDTSDVTGGFLESSDNERNPYAGRYFRNQSSQPIRDEDDGEEDCSDVEQLVIKEERVEAASAELPAENRPCPYCPAMFQSGVGLSNHVRGHLHRVGLSYNARHTVSPEEVTLRERQSQIHGRIPTGWRKMRKAVKPESQGGHPCFLSRGCFDTKTGLFHHLGGRFKQTGPSVSKSPLHVLKELPKSPKEHRDLLQVLKKSPSAGSSGGPDSLTDRSGQKQESHDFPDRKKLAVEDAKVSSSTLFELLKMKEAAGDDQEAAGRIFSMSGDDAEETQMPGLEPNGSHGQSDAENVDLQCKKTPAPCHIQASAHRRRTGISGEPGLDYKLKKPRPGLKKKILTSLDTKTYTFTCRFCGRGFRGPLSVQEEWVKHLQRHLLHTSMPHSGMRMMEVYGLHHSIKTSSSSELQGAE